MLIFDEETIENIWWLKIRYSAIAAYGAAMTGIPSQMPAMVVQWPLFSNIVVKKRL